MSFVRLLVRNVFYHWRGNLAVFLGIALGSAVLTGALLVGDSLRGSLRELTLDRLGWVEEAMVPGRFFREQLADELHCQGVVLLSGSASHAQDDAPIQHVGGVTVLGVAGEFWISSPPVDAAFWQSSAQEVVLNHTLAQQLGATVGDVITLRLPKHEDIPRESLLGKRKTRDVLQSLELKVRQVLPDAGLARFSLRPSPEPAANAFLPLKLLQSELGVAAQVNGILAPRQIRVGDIDITSLPDLNGQLRDRLKLEDWGLRLRMPEERAKAFFKSLAPNNDSGELKPARWSGRIPNDLVKAAEANRGILTLAQVVAFYEAKRDYVSLESRQLLIAPNVADAFDRAVRKLGERGGPYVAHPMLVYLVDTLAVGQVSMPYAVVAGVAPGWPHIGDLHDFGVKASTTDGDMMLMAVPEYGITDAAKGKTAEITYYAPDEQNHLQKRHASFRVTEVRSMAGWDDPDLTPEFPGITDKANMLSWENPPFPYDRKRVTPADENYWKRYRATPRAYIDLDVAQKLWGSRFGQLTSTRVYADRKTRERLPEVLSKELEPAQGGFVFQPVRANAEKASGGSADFGVLFLAFSFFLIAAALLLVGLLVRLNIDRRASEIGLLLAIGWSHARVRRLLLGEGAVLAVIGAATGLGAALIYGRLMLDLLRANWPGGESLSFLRLHAEPLSFIHGYLGSVVVSVVTILWALRVLGKLSPRSLLAGETSATGYAIARSTWSWSFVIAPASLVLGVAAMLAGFLSHGQEAKAGSFFSSGALLLTACLAGVWIWLRQTGRQSAPRPSLTALGIRNAGRHAVRSLLTVGLLAAATFLIVAVESFHKEADAEFLSREGGSGGFALVMETDVPIFQDLNQQEVRKETGLTGAGFDQVVFYSFRVRGGDDASCLNLYKPLEPRVLGVPQNLLEEKRFAFAAVLGDGTAATPWSRLSVEEADGTIPAVLDANTAEWILKKSLGEVIENNSERGEKVRLKVAAILAESIFQSEILVSAANFRRLFPGQEGFAYFLVDTGKSNAAEVARLQSVLQEKLVDQGVRVQTSASRLQAYQAVENTYLATFQALGGLGLVLGAAGLAIILLRGVWERRGELALLRALGFGAGRLAWLVLAENLALLSLGLAAGTVAALLSVAPHLAGAGAHVLWLRIGLLLLLVMATGLVAGGLAVLTTVRAPLLTALRRE